MLVMAAKILLPILLLLLPFLRQQPLSVSGFLLLVELLPRLFFLVP